MKTKQAEKVLSDAYKSLFDAVGFFPSSYIAGGAIASLILDADVNDYDIWFETKEAWDTATALVEKKLAEGSKDITLIARTDFALSFKIAGRSPMYQMVKSRVGGYDEVVESFDFQHTQAAFLPSDNEQEYKADGVDGEIVYIGYNSEEFILEKVLLFAGDLDYPTHTLSRVPKFALRGYMVPDQMLVRLIYAIREASAELIKKDATRIGLRYNKNYNYDGDELLVPEEKEDKSGKLYL